MIIDEELLRQIINEELNEIFGSNVQRAKPPNSAKDSKEAQRKLKKARLYLQKAYMELVSIGQANFRPEEIGFWTIFADKTLPDELAREFAKKIFSKF